jgi:hypothetical protein
MTPLTIYRIIRSYKLKYKHIYIKSEYLKTHVEAVTQGEMLVAVLSTGILLLS